MRVTFVRGPRRVVLGADSSPLGGVYGLVHAVRVGVDGSVLLDVSEAEVVDDELISVVTGGLVLVIVAVVVGVELPVAVAENDGSTKSSGA